MGGKKNILLKMPEGCAGPTPFQTPFQTHAAASVLGYF
jgi:hypothetical protein